jgi:hypothetical protein
MRFGVRAEIALCVSVWNWHVGAGPRRACVCGGGEQGVDAP